MARKKGFEGRSGARFSFDYGDTFDREVLTAQKKAGRKIGRAVVKERITAMSAEKKGRGIGAISPRRKKAVRSIVGRDGTLVVLDHAPMAVIRETGGIIRAKGKKLKVVDKRRGVKVATKDTFVTKGGLIFEKKKYRKQRRNSEGKPIGPKPKQPEPRLIGVLKQEVAIPQLPAPARLSNIAEKHLKEFRDLFSEYLIDGVK